MTNLTCPKCQGAMRQYERNGVTIDQCEECRGIFLDRGELERLVEMESRPAAAPAPTSYGQPAQYPPQPYPQQGGFWQGLMGGGHQGGYRRGHH